MEQKLIQNYAKLIVKQGINVQNGQEVIIFANVNNEYFVSLLMEECYKANAKKVSVRWMSDKTKFLKNYYESEEVLSTLSNWELERQKEQCEILPATIYMTSSDPEAMKGLDLEKFGRVQQSISLAMKEFYEKRENKYQWCIAGIPSIKWAKKVFPNDSEETAVEKLWEAILKTSRAYEGDPIENWKKHNEFLKQHYTYLNDLNLTSLHYKASNGTDFTVGLAKGVQWCGGGEINYENNTLYDANIPSEEIFTSPLKGKAEGIVYSSMPLSFNGILIEDFSVRFEKGKAVEIKAKRNGEFLQKQISMDENAAYLGEVALVPFDSPVNNSGILFLSTLFDENAACHLAFGQGFTSLIKGYEKLSKEEIKAYGINDDSLIHIDFMIGTKDLSIVGETEDGKKVQIFKDGNWAF